MSDTPFVPEEELTAAQPDEIETRYRAQVIERYNRLSLTGLNLRTSAPRPQKDVWLPVLTAARVRIL